MRQVLVLVLCLVSLIGFAQEKGQLIVGGGLLYQSFNDENQNITTVNRDLAVGPLFGLMIGNQIATGIRATYLSSFQSVESSNPNASSETVDYAMDLGVFGRYHGRFTDKVLYIAQLDLSKEFQLNGLTPHPQIYNASLTAGLLYFIAKKVSLGMNVASVNFNTFKLESQNINRSSFIVDYNIINPSFEVIFYL